jgi:hypothetical protein
MLEQAIILPRRGRGRPGADAMAQYVSHLSAEAMDAALHPEMETEMKREDLWSARYLRANDLRGQPATVTIEAAIPQVLRDSKGERTKLVLHFVNRTKALVVNQVNFDAIVSVTGIDDSDHWPGQAVELYPTTTMLGGKPTACIRVRAPKQAARRAPAPTEPATETLEESPFLINPTVAAAAHAAVHNSTRLIMTNYKHRSARPPRPFQYLYDGRDLLAVLEQSSNGWHVLAGGRHDIGTCANREAALRLAHTLSISPSS